MPEAHGGLYYSYIILLYILIYNKHPLLFSDRRSTLALDDVCLSSTRYTVEPGNSL